ncbi:androgen dependent TFPI regulating protein 1 [Brienomyrus brachyistius]|uniref:androgen dependent TFPI regulating protein 1 n=1 Tax=Brienomyrus brachyistius TaxID=42636 RepID=UPI0020B41C73|nr:androgen dependent TFPI regulating protein 1 [Brienomyrus brachyistius]
MAAVTVPPRWRAFIHLMVFVWAVYVVNRNCSLAITKRHPGVNSYGGRWKYLTFINLVMQALFFGLCCLIDMIHQLFYAPHGRCPKFLIKTQDIFFTVFVFPVGTFVFISFWFLYAIDRELVYPKHIDSIIPLWLNHAMHTVIMLLLLIELYLQPHQYPRRMKGLMGLALFSALYLAWILWVHQASGIWVYPILAHLSPVKMVLFFAASALFMAPLYLLGEKLSHKYWGDVGSQKKK